MNKLHRKYFSDYFLNFNMPKNGTEKDGEAPRIPSIIYKMFNVIFRSLFTSTEEGTEEEVMFWEGEARGPSKLTYPGSHILT